MSLENSTGLRMPSESKRCAILRVTKTSGVFQVTVHTGAPAEKTTVFLLCMMIQRAADKWELLASSRTIFIGGRDMQFRDSALSWVNVLFQQYLNGELKDKVLVDYFNDLRRWSAAVFSGAKALFSRTGCCWIMAFCVCESWSIEAAAVTGLCARRFFWLCSHAQTTYSGDRGWACFHCNYLCNVLEPEQCCRAWGVDQSGTHTFARLLWTCRRCLAQISFAGRVADPIHVPGAIDRDEDNRPL